MKCACYTTKGLKCKRDAKEGSKYCPSHKGRKSCNASPKKATARKTPKKATGRKTPKASPRPSHLCGCLSKTTGRQCQNKVRDSVKHCKRHRRSCREGPSRK